MKKESIKEKFKNIKCRSCGKNSLISILEEEYDYEISCSNCGDLWWIEKEKVIGLKGDDLKYISYVNFEDDKKDEDK